MKVVIKVETWSQAHHLGCILKDAEHKFRQSGLDAFADFFKATAEDITEQAWTLNEVEWEERKKRL